MSVNYWYTAAILPGGQVVTERGYCDEGVARSCAAHLQATQSANGATFVVLSANALAQARA